MGADESVPALYMTVGSGSAVKLVMQFTLPWNNN